MREFITKVIAFFAKEFHDVRRQPRLMLSLIGGPLLVLAAFGATYQSSNPFVSTVLVWPKEGIPGVDRDQATKYIGTNFYLAGVIEDEAKAMQMLNDGEVDVIQILPSVPKDGFSDGSRPEIRVLSRTINPNVEAWTRSLAFSETNYINRSILSQEASNSQDKALEVDDSLEGALKEYESINRSFDETEIEHAYEITNELQLVLQDLLNILPPESLAQANLSPELSSLYTKIQLLSDDLKELEHVLDLGELPVLHERLESTIEEIKSLKVAIDVFIAVPPVNIISPIRETYTNLRGSVYSMVVFFAPSVLALLVQQMAVTLGSLGLVRERQMGSFEMFRVAPLRFTQLLLGKSLAYILFVSIAGGILTGLLSILNVPLPVNTLHFLLLLLLLAMASVGIGFLISSVSRSDSQAIQLTMLLLLLSIFFTGFFMPLTGFSWPAWIIAYLIPMTHAIPGFQDVLLSGTSVGVGEFQGLIFIALISFGLVLLIMRRQYKQVLD